MVLNRMYDKTLPASEAKRKAYAADCGL